MTMDKYSVDRRAVQKNALAQTRAKLTELRREHEKTAAQAQEVDRLEAEVNALEHALAEQ